MTRLVNNVNRENYQQVGSAFIATYGSSVIALKGGQEQGVEYGPTPRQWGAWLAYFKARKIPTKFMTERGKAGKCWTVPAEWPHMFDADATIVGDSEAADLFLQGTWSPHGDFRHALNSELRKAVVARLMKNFRRPMHDPRDAKVTPPKREISSSDDCKTKPAPPSDLLLRHLSETAPEYLSPEALAKLAQTTK